jgi:hypothetical protein
MEFSFSFYIHCCFVYLLGLQVSFTADTTVFTVIDRLFQSSTQPRNVPPCISRGIRCFLEFMPMFTDRPVFLKMLRIKGNKVKRLVKTCIREVLGFNLVRDTGNHEKLTVDVLIVSRQVTRYYLD